MGQGARHSALPKIIIDGPPVVTPERVRSWVSTLPFRTFPFEDRPVLDHVRKVHPWIKSLSETKVPGGRRILRVRFHAPVALLRPSYGLMAFQKPVVQAVPARVSYLTDQGNSLMGEPFGGSGVLPQVVVRSPLTRSVGLRLVRTIRTVNRCRSSGAPDGRWYSLNGPHEIRFYPGSGLPVLLLGTDLGCAPFRLYRSFLNHRERLLNGRLANGPEGVDLRFSGMLVLVPVLDGKPDSGIRKDPGPLSGSY